MGITFNIKIFCWGIKLLERILINKKLFIIKNFIFIILRIFIHIIYLTLIYIKKNKNFFIALNHNEFEVISRVGYHR